MQDFFFFFLRKVFEVRETGNPEVPLYFGEGLRRSLGNAAGCGGAGQMGCAGLSFAWMLLCAVFRRLINWQGVGVEEK